MRPNPRSARWGLLGVLLVALAAPAAASAQDAPSLRLIAADAHVRLSVDELAEPLDLGLWVAASGGDFQLRLLRPGYGSWQAVQADAQSGATIRAIPERLLDEGGGLRNFVSIRFLDRRGRVVARQTRSFCPSGYERIDAHGPPAPTYMPLCGFTFPFARGGGWGIDDGWASSLVSEFFEEPDFEDLEGSDEPELSASLHDESGEPGLRLRPGVYKVVARIAAPQRRLFGIPAARAQATLRVRVTRRARRRAEEDGQEPGLARAGARGASQPALSEQSTDQPDPASLPDLVALPPWAISVQRDGRRDLLAFAGSPWNAGPGRLVVEGYRRRGTEVMDAVQHFVDSGGQVTGTAPAGTMEFHDQRGHHHWHFLQFVGYRLLRPSGGTVVRARKQAFCLAATDLVDPWLPGAERVPESLGLSGAACGTPSSLWIRQQLPAGWGDTYGPDIAGQQFDITTVPNGRYLLEMHVNPRGQLREATTENNVERRTVILRGRRGARSVRVLPWHGIGD